MDPIGQILNDGQRAIDAADVHALEAALAQLEDVLRPTSNVQQTMDDGRRTKDDLRRTLDDGRWTLAHRWRGIAALFRGDGATARTEFLRALEIHTQNNDELGMANAAHDLNILDFREGRYGEVIARCPQMIETLLRLNALVSAANGMDIYASALQHTGRYDEALTHYHKALELYQQTQIDAGIGHVLANIGTLYGTMGELPNAIEAGRKALDIFIANDDTYSIARTRTNLGYAYFRLGDLVAALEMYVKALEGYTHIHDRESIALAHLNIGTVKAEMNDHQRTMAEYTIAVAEFIDMDRPSYAANTLINLGRSQLAVDDVDGAMISAQRAYDLAVANNDHIILTEALSSLITLALHTNDLDAAETLIAELAPFTTGSAGAMLNHHRQHADLLVRREQFIDAAMLLNSAYAAAVDAGMKPEQRDIALRLRELAAQRRDIDAYITFNQRYIALHDEILGDEQRKRLDATERERAISEERRLLEKQRTILVNMLPEVIADKMLQGASSIVEHYDEVSVLFLDLVNFTGLAERISPQELITTLNDLFKQFDEIIAHHGLTKIKTIGDAYLAVGNAPTPLEDHVNHAVHAAMKMIDVVNNHGSELAARIGLHVGPVVGGVVGTSRTAWDVWGDAVNIAARMEQTGEAGRIHVSEEFSVKCGRVQGWKVEERGIVEVKGKGRMRTYWINRITE